MHVSLCLSVCLPICLLSNRLCPVLLSGEAGRWTVVVYTVSKLQGHPFKAFLIVKSALWLLVLLSLAKVMLTSGYWVCGRRPALRSDSEPGLLALRWDIFLSSSAPPVFFAMFLILIFPPSFLACCSYYRNNTGLI